MPDTAFIIDRKRLQIIHTRVFNAPPQRIWRALTDPAAIPQWWGPRDMQTTVDAMQFTVGGAWRYVQRDSQGHEHTFHGEYLEIAPPERLVSTFVFEGAPEHSLVSTITLTALPNGKTEYAEVAQYYSAEALEGMVAVGMENGVRQSLKRLGDLVHNQSNKK